MKRIATIIVLVGVLVVSVIGQKQVNRCCESSHPGPTCNEVNIDSKTLIKNRISCVEPKIDPNERYSSPVVVKVIVDPDGFVDCATIYRSVPDGIKDAVIDAVKKWKFRVFKVKNQPVAVTSLVAVAITGNTGNQCANKEGQ